MFNRSLLHTIRWIFLDILICIFSLIVTAYLKYDFQIPESYKSEFAIYLICFVCTFIVCNAVMDCYKRVFKHSGISEAIRQIFAAMIASIILLICKWLGVNNFSRSIIIMFCFINGFIMVVARFYSRLFYQMKGNITKNNVLNVMIIGGGEAGSLLIRRLHESELNRRPVVILDDDKDLWGSKVNSVPVAGGDSMILSMIEKYKIDEIIIAVPSITNEKKRFIYNICLEANISLKVFPCVVNMDEAEANGKNTLMDVNYEDLLGRGTVNIQKDQVTDYVKDKVVLVTGGAGSIGSEICRQALSFECKLLILIDFNENGLFDIENELTSKFSKNRLVIKLISIRDKNRMDYIFKKYKPEIVFHAAAHKHVPLMEVNATEAVKNNIFGTLNVIKCSYENNVKRLMLISSDKAVNPANVMGATKRISEMLMQVYNGRGRTEMACVRFGNVLGSNGSVLLIFKKQILEGGPLTLTHENVTRYFMTIPEAVQLVLQASALSKGGEIFFLDMGEPVRIYDLACNLIKQAGLVPDKDIKIEITGLRPGEKLFEELKLAVENVSKTKHEMIFVCNSDIPKEREMLHALEIFKSAIDDNNEEFIKEYLFQIVPDTYRLNEYNLNKETLKNKKELIINTERAIEA